MAGNIRLFEKAADGKLVEVEDTPALRGSRRVSRMAAEIDVLFTADEEAQRDAEERRFVMDSEAAIKQQAARELVREAAMTKLMTRLELSRTEAEAIVSGMTATGLPSA